MSRNPHLAEIPAEIHAENRIEAATIILAFSSLGVNSPGKAFEFASILKRDDCAAIVLRDTASSWYHTMPGCQSEQLLAFLQTRIAGYARVVCMGYSMGGYAALKYGGLLKAQQILAFAPQTALSHQTLSAMGDYRWEEYLPRVRHELGDTDRLDLTAEPDNRGISIFVAQHGCAFDMEHANRLSASGEIVAIGSGPMEHGALIVAFRESNILRQLINAAASSDPLPNAQGLYASWERAHDHHIEIVHVARDAVTVTVRGTLHITGNMDLDLHRHRSHPIRLGARLYRSGVSHWMQEQRFDFNAPSLRSGHSYPFCIEMPWRADGAFMAELRLALVREGRFWFDDLGLGQAVLKLSAHARSRLDNALPPNPFGRLPGE